ncbi:MAG: SAM-dependent methyltransferase [Micromonosporaceae bacterium]
MAGADLSRPSAARVYDYYLGGSHNFAVDRDMAKQAIEMWPDLPRIIRSNRAFLRRAVQYLVGQGVRQFLDLGSGIPTVGNVHEIAQQAAPEARVVYVDIDPVAVSHGRAILSENPLVTFIQADLRDPARVLAEPALKDLLDLEEPVAVLMVAVLHFVPDGEDPRGLVRLYRDLVAPGSHLALSHASADGHSEEGRSHEQLYARTPTPMSMRSHAQITMLLDGWDLVEPGLVHIPLWHPDPSDPSAGSEDTLVGYAAVGRKA